jgi:hypothetical protein
MIVYKTVNQPPERCHAVAFAFAFLVVIPEGDLLLPLLLLTEHPKTGQGKPAPFHPIEHGGNLLQSPIVRYYGEALTRKNLA